MRKMWGVVLAKPFRGHKRSIYAIAHDNGWSVIDTYYDSFVVRDESGEATADDIFGAFDSELSDIGLGVMLNRVVKVEEVLR